MPSGPVLENFKILIADSDQHLSSVFKFMLRGMGFSNITVTPSGKDALEMVKSGGFDFLVTDWSLKGMDGISLLKHIRRDHDSTNATIPVIMLTGRKEQSDVQTARDSGIHEYVAKPFSAKTVYSRLERIVEAPRYFVITPQYVGPDRRHKNIPVEVDRRKKPLMAQRKPRDVAMAINAVEEPKLWLPDFSLKHKLGRHISLDSIITPNVLNQAQAAMDSAAEASRQWIEDDMAELKALCAELAVGKQSEAVINEIVEVALMISSRSGTFGYLRASEVAYLLYLFCRQKLRPVNPGHLIVIEKHLEVLALIFGTNIRNEEGDILQIIKELKNLTAKYAP